MDQLRVKIVKKGARPPERANSGDLGYDLFSAENVLIPTGSMAPVRSGIALEFPAGWGGIIKDRSSMAMKRITTSAGVVDSGYRGELIVLLSNHSKDDFTVAVGDKIAQLIPVEETAWSIVMADELGDSARQTKGFGSSGS